MKQYIFLILLFSVFQLFSQNKTIEGRVVDDSGNPIPGTTIVIANVENSSDIINYSITDINGFYKITEVQNLNSVLIQISHIGYIKIEEQISIEESVTTYNATMKVDPNKLDVVILKVRKIKDTMKIQTDSLKLSDRSTLREILDQTEGFIISDDGSISFRGTQINKILINKKEVFINQNKTALDNLDFDIMDGLQLINNYRDKFNIDFDNFTETVINVDTKKEFKGIFKASGEAAYGANNKYGLKAKTFFFSDQFNMFFTNNTNNFGDKDFSFKDIAAPFKTNSSTFFKNQVTPFFAQDELSKEAFDSNSSLTLRKEGDKYRSGLVVYYNNMLQENERELSTTAATGERVKEESRNLEKSGNLLTVNFALNYLLGKRTGLNLTSNVGYANLTRGENLFIENFLPTQNTITENIETLPKVLLLANSLNIKSLIAKDVKFSTGISNSYERSEDNFLSTFTIVETDNITQNYSFTNSNIKSFFDIQKRYNKLLTIAGGGEVSFFEESVLEGIDNTKSRKGFLYEPYILVRGNNVKWDYTLKMSQQFYDFSNEGETINRRRPSISSSLDYQPDGNNNFKLSYSQDNSMPDLYNTIDTLNISFNSKLLGLQSISKTVSSSSDFQVAFYNSNFSKSQNYSISYTHSVNYDFIEPIFVNVSGNVFFYQNFLIDKKTSDRINLNAGKGFYFGENYHKIRLSGGSSYSLSNFPTLFNGERLDFSQENYGYNFAVTFEPQNFFADRFKLNAGWSFSNLELEDDEINNQKEFNLIGSITRKRNDLEFEFSGGFRRFQNADVDFIYPLLDFNFTMTLNDKVEVYTRGQNLFHLLQTANTENTGLVINSDGNFINRSVNRFNLKYIIFGIAYRP